jgi:predicted metal-dependent peptidase
MCDSHKIFTTSIYSYYTKPGGTVRGEVRARDVIGHVSGLVSSNGIIIDTTAPVRAKRIQCQLNSLSDASFENIANYEDNMTICDNITKSQWDLSEDTCVTLEKSNMAQHGSIKLHLQGSILQKLNTTMHGKYR